MKANQHDLSALRRFNRNCALRITCHGCCCRKCTEYWYGIGPVLERERAIEMKEASWWLMKRYSRISSVNLFFSFIPAALRIVRIDLAVRPSFPITLPRSL